MVCGCACVEVRKHTPQASRKGIWCRGNGTEPMPVAAQKLAPKHGKLFDADEQAIELGRGEQGNMFRNTHTSAGRKTYDAKAESA